MKEWSRKWSSMGAAMMLGSMMALSMLGCASSDGGGGGPSSADDAGGNLVGQQAPSIQAEAVGGDGPTTLADAKGKVAIVDFWATFCDPCRKSFPKYQELADKHGGDLVVIGVSVDDPDDVGTEEVMAFATDLGVTFPIVWDKERKTADAYSPPKMPTSYIVDKAGVIRYIHAGYQADEADEIAKEVAELVAE